MQVTTINNEVLDKSLTRKIRGNYYKIGDTNVEHSGDCFKINDRFYTLEKEKIVWDNYLNQYVLKNEKVIYGIIKHDLDHGLKYGWFNNVENKDVCIIYFNKIKKVYCINRNIKLLSDYLYNGINVYFNPRYFTYSDIIPRQQVDSSYKTSLPYNLSSLKSKIYTFTKNDNIEILYNNFKPILQDLTFGVEFETVRGVVPDSICKNINLHPLRDGSISGLEYVSTPLRGKEGFYNFIEIIHQLNKYTDSDHNCSMHIHVGNLPRTPAFILASFKLLYMLQDDMYKYFPYYKKYKSFLKRKHYTQPLSSKLFNEIDSKITSDNLYKNFNYLLNDLTSGAINNINDIDDLTTHPRDSGNNRKWDIIERYKIVNVIPILFTNKQTIEFRLFTCPNSINKAILFLMMSLLPIYYIKNHYNRIINNSNEFLLNSLGDLNRTLTDSSWFQESLHYRSHQIENLKANFQENEVIDNININYEGTF